MTSRRGEYAVPLDPPLAPGEKRTLDVPGKGQVVLARNASGTYFAVKGTCPHQGGPLGSGRLGGVTEAEPGGPYGVARQGEILRCPWHGFSFDVTTGTCLAHDRLRVAAYGVRVEGDRAIITL